MTVPQPRTSAHVMRLSVYSSPLAAHTTCLRDFFSLPYSPFPHAHASLFHPSSQHALHPFHSCLYQRIVVSPRLRVVLARHLPCLPISSTPAIWTCMLQPRVSVNTKSWSLVVHCMNDQSPICRNDTSFARGLGGKNKRIQICFQSLQCSTSMACLRF
jgi:hypothetical protein